MAEFEKLRPVRKSSRQTRLPSHLKDYVIQQYRETPSVSSASTTSSKMDRLQMERDFIRDDVDRYCSQATDLLKNGVNLNALQRIESRLEKSSSELKDVTGKILDTGEEQFPEQIQDAAHVYSITKRQIEQCQDKIAEAKETPPQQPEMRKKVTITPPSEKESTGQYLENSELAAIRAAEVRTRYLELRRRMVEAEKEKLEKELQSKSRQTRQPIVKQESPASPILPSPAQRLIKGEPVDMQTIPEPVNNPSRSVRPKVRTASTPLPEKPAESKTTSKTQSRLEEEELKKFFQGMAKPKLPNFNGDRQKYQDWWGQFDAFVHQAKVPTRFKMMMLKDSLTGKAADLVKGLGYTEIQYAAAIKKLNTRYGGQTRMVQSLIDSILKVDPIDMKELEKLERFNNLLADIIAKLYDAGQQNELQGPSTLYTLVQQRIPDELLVEYKSSHPATRDGLETFVEWLGEQVTLRLDTAELKTGTKKKDSQKGNWKRKTNLKENSKPANSRTLATESETKADRKQSSTPAQTSIETECPICKERHKTASCAEWRKATVQGRWSLAKEHRICYRCLQVGHQGKDCKTSKKCGIEACEKTHHRSLHPVADTSESKSKESSTKVEKQASAFGIENGKIVTSQVALRLVPVLLGGVDGKQRQVNALLDDGSDSTYVRSEIVQSLGLTVQNKPLCISTITEKDTEVDSGLVQIVIESLNGETRRKLGARTLRNLCDNLRPPDWNKLKTKWKHLEEITFPKLENRKIDILIGSDHPELTLALEEKIGKPGEPVARKTPLGWTCVGTFGPPKGDGIVTYAQCYFSAPTMDEELRKLWNSDIIPPSSDTCVYTAEEKLALQKAEDTLEFLGDRYKIGITWAKDKPELKDNYAMAEKRLLSEERSLIKRPEVGEAVREVFRGNIEKTYVREISEEEKKTPGWYLPHFAVVREDRETTKTRLVYDAAATYDNKSLNSEMLAGPKLQLDVLDILISFRSGTVALMGDVKEMFCQIVMAEDCRRFHRILWRDLNQEAPIKVYEATRLIFGDKASPFLAQYVIRQHAERLKEEYPLAAEVCRKFIYMDDAMRSLDEVEVIKRLRRELSELLERGGFKIRKWMSNSHEVLKDIPEEDRATGIIELEEAGLPCVKALGVRWDAEKDVLGFSHSEVQQGTVTKRSLLSIIARLFDPLSLLAPFTIRAKILLQEAWIKGLDWDEPFPPALEDQAQAWIKEVTQVTNFEIPRCLHRGSPQRTSLHTFTDASKLAYGAVVYARNQYLDGSVSVRIVVAKARVTPLKAISIPRLELLAAMLGLRLAVRVSNLLQIEDLVYWSDSMDVIYWIHGQSRQYKPFIAHRIGEIQEKSIPSQWRHVPGHKNPADLATRGAKLDEILADSVWTNGPEFLYESEECWPETKKLEKIGLSEDAQKDSGKSQVSSTIVVESDRQENNPIDSSRFSSWLRLTRTTAWVLRLVQIARSKEKSQFQKPYLEVQEIEKAEEYWIRQIQYKKYGDTIQRLINRKPNPSGPLRSLRPFLDEEGLLRVGGRLQESNLPYEAKHPFIVPARNHVTTLLVRHTHGVTCKHAEGVNAVLAELRQKYWVIDGREEAKRVDNQCVPCRIRKKKAAKQLMAPLPPFRVTVPLRAFSRSAVDFAGPFIVKITRRVEAKRWLCLFTCTASRAVHLEMAYTLDTDGFLNTFTRMTSRRGKPERVVSDNGTNFIGADRELGELVQALDQEKIINDAANKGIKWKFNPPLGSHHGGLFEALIKSAKVALKAILGNAKLHDEELHTAIVEVEGLMNSRPLTYTSNDPKDENVLTPNHFLMGQAGGQLAPRIIDEIAYNPRKRWRLVQDLVSQVWRRWQKEFLSLLQNRGKWWTEERNLAVDDIVMLVDPTNPRGKWPLGRILDTYPGKDTHVRTVRVLSNGKEFVRPITKLCPLVFEDRKVVAEPFGHGGEDVQAHDSRRRNAPSRNISRDEHAAPGFRHFVPALEKVSSKLSIYPEDNDVIGSDRNQSYS